MKPTATDTPIVVPLPDPLTPAEDVAPPADCSPQELERRRLFATLDGLYHDARQQRSREPFVDCMAWMLARVIVDLDDQRVSGDILRRLGSYIGLHAEARRAESEAAVARQDGHTPH